MSRPSLPSPKSRPAAPRLRIRPAGQRDIPALVALNARVQSLHARAQPTLFRDRPPPKEVAAGFAKMIAEPSAFWLLAKAPQAAGYLYAQFHVRPATWFRPLIRVCNISHLAIHPAFRRRGLSRRLIAALRAEAAKRGFRRIELDVWSFNHGARACFDRLGFEVFNERRVFVDSAQRTRPAKGKG